MDWQQALLNFLDFLVTRMNQAVDLVHEHITGLLFPFVTGLSFLVFYMWRQSHKKIDREREEWRAWFAKTDSKLDQLLLALQSKVDVAEFRRHVDEELEGRRRAGTRLEKLEQQNQNIEIRLAKAGF